MVAVIMLKLKTRLETITAVVAGSDTVTSGAEVMAPVAAPVRLKAGGDTEAPTVLPTGDGADIDGAKAVATGTTELELTVEG